MRRDYKSISGGVLPSGYAECEYIESTGTQYIDTGVKCTPKLRIIMDTSWTTVQSNLSNGVQDWKNGIIFRIDHFPSPNGIYICYGNHSGAFQLATKVGGDTDRYLIDVSNGHQFVDGVEYGNLTMTNTSNWNFYISAVNQQFAGNINYYSKQRYYKVEQYVESSIERNFIPAILLSNNKPGLYDLCGSICPLTGTPFYINGGTGEFLYKLK